MGSGAELGFFESLADELIDEARRARSGRKRFPAPVFRFAFFEVKSDGVVSSGRGGFVRPGRSVFDPRFEVCDDGIGKLRFWRHFHIGIFIADDFDKEGLLGVAWNEGGPGIAPFQEAFTRIEVEIGFEFL